MKTALFVDASFDTKLLLQVLTAVRNGDFSARLPVEWTGLNGKIADAFNDIVEMNDRLARETERAAKVVGKEGKTSHRLNLGRVEGAWASQTECLNTLITDLTAPTREMARVIGAVAKGDLTQNVALEVDSRPLQGEFLRAGKTVNAMVEQLGAFTAEVTRVAREVGTDGKLGGQAKVEGVSGTWKDLTESVNSMASNLTAQVRNIADVTISVASGDLSKKITVDVRGEFLQLKDTINTMVDQLRGFASEVSRVAKEVGTDGKLGGQAVVPGVAGVWKDLTDNVNGMAANLTAQVRNLAEVTTSIAKGDLNRKITVEVKGEMLELKNTVNTMVEQLNSFASEVTRVAREVGTDGKLGGQADVKGVAGTWRDLTENVNGMAANLTAQVRNIAQVTTAVANGDLGKKITVDAKGEILELKDTINTMVEQLNGFASEVTRVAREVGTDGKLGGQADVPGVAGTWKDLTDNVNGMAANLTAQVRNIAQVTTAVANGDLGKKITVDAKGEILELKNTINTMVDQLNSFASEVTRVAREVGTDGKLGGQADVKGVGGTWKDLTENVNFMAANLTNQVRNIADVTTAVANGDLNLKITVDARGEILELKNTINAMVDRLNSFAAEVTRVAREVGTDGKLGGQADVKGVGGTWKDLTDNVNGMAANLTAQVRNIATVTTAVANGDLGKKITVDAKGEILELKSTINTMVEQLNSFASEVTRVAREVGTDGKLGGQADVKGVGGTWKDLTDNVNFMAANLTAQVRNIATVTTAVANGDLNRKITVDAKGEILELKNTVNTMVDQLNSFASEVTRVSREVGTEGKLGGQAQVRGVGGTWKDLTENVNFMAANLTSQVRNIATVTTAVANGDLNLKITVDARGEILELKNTINAMVDRLNSFAAEVTRVSREVGTEGKLGGQAQVRGVAGTWKDLTDNVNLMAANLTDQVRGIARVVTAVANGNLKLKLTVEAKGEIAALADTINNMIDTLATFAEQVTGVAREVGVEGRLGGQANVPGAAGTWKDLTDNVNRLAANLTTQVRAIADVSTAVTKGDLSRSITVEAAGEVALLKDNVNEMIRNLKGTTTKNTEQDWLKSNLATFTRKLQGQRDLQQVCQMTLSELAPLVGAQHGAFYINDPSQDEALMKLLASYAFRERKNLANQFKSGEGLIGQCILEKERILLTNVPSDYVKISSGLGEATPINLVVLPVVFEGKVKAIIELASFQQFSEIHLNFLDQLMESLGIVINTIQTNMRTEELLKQSQSLTKELQSQQEELQQTNEELEEKARLLGEQKIEVERKNRQVEDARLALEEKAAQLALTSKYKSEFLANMSHELRTPLNSLLILSQQLEENGEKNLTDKQVKFARTIHGAGSELLTLINDILDLSKIESGTSTIEIDDVVVADVAEDTERTFRHVAEKKGLEFDLTVTPGMPAVLRTDRKRLQQVLKNLLSNAFKFTEKGKVELRIHPADGGWSPDHKSLGRAKSVVAFAVSDTGIGIAADKRRIIFEAFQQADGSTARKYGGTGLGLAISREIAILLGGELRLNVSQVGVGSTFTLYLPVDYRPPQPVPATEPARTTPDTPPAEPRPLPPVRYDTPPRHTASRENAPAPVEAPGDDLATLTPADKVVLIVEDDPKFADVLLDTAHEKGFKGVVASNGEKALALARQRGFSAITLDIRLPDIDGWTVLDRLKLDPNTRHIPVHVISVETDTQHALTHGAIACVTKPLTKESLDAAFEKLWTFAETRVRNLLIVEDSETERQGIVDLIGNGDVKTTAVGTGAEALKALAAEHFDCMVLDLVLPDISGFQVLDEIKQHPELCQMPVVINTAKALTKKEELRLRAVADTIVLKGVHSPERLLDETALFLHRVTANLPEPKRQILHQLYASDSVLEGKTVLVVDDDVRNLFALTSVLEAHRLRLLTAENGKEALKTLEQTPGVNAVLMDIMMPEMDGYDTMKAIRQQAKFKSLPIIALTAKAMKGDREKCIEAGANDYIAKPVDSNQLLSLLRVWLYR